MSTIVTCPTGHWYVVASSDEVGDGLVARTVSGMHLVLYRTSAGDVVALDDRCPHRSYPLSLGQRVGDDVQCGYHGITFDSCGTCVWVPGQEKITTKANVTARAVVERDPWIFVFAGDPADADAAEVPELPWFASDDWAVVHGMEPLAARWGLLVDNLLDLSHETFLHGGFIGTPEVATTPIETEVDEAAAVVRVSRHMEAVECPPFYANSTGLSSPIDRWQDIEYHAPGFYLLHVRVAAAGEPVTESDDKAAHVKVLYGITPVDDHNTLDFWAVCRDFAVDDDQVSGFMEKMNREVVLQDVVALDRLEARLGDDFDPPEVSFKIDTGSLAARRVNAALVSGD